MFLLGVAILFLRFPPIYFLGIKNSLLMTHILSIFFILINFFLLLVWIIRKNKKSLIQTREDVLLLVFIIAQSISIFGAVNIEVFLQRYGKIVIAFLLYLVVRNYSQGFYKSRFSKYLINSFIIGGFVALTLQLLIYFFPSFYLSLGNYLIYDNVLITTSANILAGKLFDDSYLEIVIPFALFAFAQEKKNYPKKVLLFALILGVGFTAFISNFRYRLIAFIFAFIVSTLLMKRIKKILFFAFILIFICIFTFSELIIRDIQGYTIVDRILLQSKEYDVGTITWRLYMFNESLSMAKNFPITGVGLGNFYDSLPNSFKSILTLDYSQRQEIQTLALLVGPHNIFFQFLAETGFVGLFVFIILLYFYLKKDIAIVKKNSTLSFQKIPFIISFWTLIVIAEFFPSVNLTFYIMFFLLRGMI